MPENQVHRTPFQLEPRPGELLRGDLWTGVPTVEPAGRAVLVCHGFKGFKDWGFFPHAARHLSSQLACPVATFNFTGSGIGADLQNFTEPEAFGHNTFSKEVEDAAAVLDGLEAGRLGEVTFPAATRIGTLGHSRGGVAAILSAERPTVRATVTWSAIASALRYARLFEGVPPGDPVPIRNARTGQVLPLYRDVLRDIEKDPERFDLVASLKRSGVPLLVIHGTADGSVPAADARQLASATDGAHLELIEGAGHTFEVGHPFEGPSEELNRVLELTTQHFSASL